MKRFFIYCRHVHTGSMYVFVLYFVTYWQAYKITEAVTTQCSALARKQTAEHHKIFFYIGGILLTYGPIQAHMCHLLG
jgi:hypothetical protein